jgi:hypothetical protein
VASPAGLVHSLIVKIQRATLDEIGARAGTPVVYLKGAWADPVLYGGRGERTGGDIDVLVRPEAVDGVAQALERRGYRRWQFASRLHERYYTRKALTLLPPAGALAVDVHRELAHPAWFDLPAASLIERAVMYDSADGPILSLCPEDQVLYAAVHYANHLFAWDGRHLEDIVRLLATRVIDWEQIRQRADAAGARFALQLLIECLLERGVPVQGGLAALSWGLRLRRRVMDRWLPAETLLTPRPRPSRALKYLVLRPLLSDRYGTIPRLIAGVAGSWVRERLAGKTVVF